MEWAAQLSVSVLGRSPELRVITNANNRRFASATAAITVPIANFTFPRAFDLPFRTSGNRVDCRTSRRER